jgi:hypothetical protein
MDLVASIVTLMYKNVRVFVEAQVYVRVRFVSRVMVKPIGDVKEEGVGIRVMV